MTLMNKLIPLIFIVLFSLEGFSQTLVGKQQAIEDLDFYHKTLQEVHYNPFLYIKKEDYIAEVEKVKRNFPDSVPVNQLIISLYQLSSLMQDGHLSPYLVQPPLQEELKKEQFFPYPLIVENNKFYVSSGTALASGLPVGAEITAINHKEVTPFLQQAHAYNGGSEAFKKEMSMMLLSYYLFLSDIKAPFTIEYTDSAGKKGQRTIEKGLTFGKALSLTMPAIKGKNSCRIVDNKLGIIEFMNMGGDWQTFSHFLDSCFTTFEANNIKHIAIDLRKNSGGNSILGDLLLSYLTDKKFKMMGGRRWKISQQYKDFLVANGNTPHPYLQEENGSIWEAGSCEPQENPFVMDSKFSGEVYFLTGPFTFSSANMLADAVKNYKIAPLIGEPTGENTNDFGEVYTFELPNSKILMNATTAFDFGADCNKTSSSPVLPDLHIATNLTDKIYNKDPAVEYLLSTINTEQ